MTKVMTIWGREFELEVVFDCYEGESILLMQRQALKAFVAQRSVFLSYAWRYAQDKVKEYILSHNGNDVPSQTIDNIFKYVVPASLYIRRNDTAREIGVMCHYRFDAEHGLAILFKNEKFICVDTQDSIL